MTFYRDLNGFVFASYSDGNIMEIQVNDFVFVRIKVFSQNLITIKEDAIGPHFNIQNFTLVSTFKEFLPLNFLPDNISYYNISEETHQWIKDNLGLYD